jgi:hypothetical protein
MALAELRRETEKVEKSKRAIIHAAWAMAIVGLVVLCGLGGWLWPRFGRMRISFGLDRRRSRATGARRLLRS